MYEIEKVVLENDEKEYGRALTAIKALIDEGRSDGEAEALRLADPWPKLVEYVKQRLSEARAKRAKAKPLHNLWRDLTAKVGEEAGPIDAPKAEKDFLSAPTQPEVESTATLDGLLKELEEEQAEPKATAELEKLEPDPAPGPKVSGETNPQSEWPRPDVRAEGPAFLSKATPMDAASQFAKDQLYVQGNLATYYFHGDWWQWNGRFYEMAPHDRISGMVYNYLQSARVRTGEGDERYKPKPENADALLKCLKVCVAIDDRDMPPKWLDDRLASADGLLVFRNCLVNAKTGEVFALTPQLWAQGGVDFDFAANARCPRWEQFLEEIFPGDPERQATIEETDLRKVLFGSGRRGVERAR
jgi:hypothetical protein